MLIPHTQLKPETLDDLLTDFVTRVGTYGDATTIDERKSQLLSQLESEQAFITYNYEHQQPCLVARHQVSESAIRDFKVIKQALLDEVAEEAAEREAMTEFLDLHRKLSEDGVFPIDLGRTVMSGATGALLQAGKVRLDQLQDLLYRHSKGDYGLVPWTDKLSNLKSIATKDYMLSRYEISGVHLYVEMLADWPQTMVMLVSER